MKQKTHSWLPYIRPFLLKDVHLSKEINLKKDEGQDDRVKFNPPSNCV